MCWPVGETDEGSVETRKGIRVAVADRLRRPVIEGTPVPGPWLFLGAVGLRDRISGYECLQGWAQPIMSFHWPIPVDSDAERLAFQTLQVMLTELQRNFPDARFALEKPVFELDTPDGACIPDFIVSARRGADIVQFVIEVMGFERPAYLKGKQVTHPRMARLGHLCLMDATRFGESFHRVRTEGRKVTRSINEVLRKRWRPG